MGRNDRGTSQAKGKCGGTIMRRSHSYSKREILEKCLRQYFYQYYASDKRNPYDDTKKQIIRQLKEMSGCYLLAGEILHSLIATYFRKGYDWGAQWYFSNAEKRYNKHLSYSREPDNNAHKLKEQYPPKMLLEYYYDNSKAEDVANQAQERLIQALNNFFNKDDFSILRKTLLESQLLIEEKISGLKINDYGIDGKLDVVAIDETGNKIWIIDWKLGFQDGEQNSLQLFTYSWWASEKAPFSSSEVKFQRAFLGGGIIEKECFLDESLLRRGKARLIQDIELMKELDSYGKAGNEKAFSQCQKEKVCAQCKYQQICL